MFGNPEFYVSSSPDAGLTSTKPIVQLPGTEAEITELRQLLVSKGWDIQDYMAMKAAEDSVKSLNSPKVFHIATHGFFTPQRTQTTHPSAKLKYQGR